MDEGRVEVVDRLGVSDQWLTVSLLLVLGILVAPTAFGQGVLDVVGQLAQGVTESGSP